MKLLLVCRRCLDSHGKNERRGELAAGAAAVWAGLSAVSARFDPVIYFVGRQAQPKGWPKVKARNVVMQQALVSSTLRSGLTISAGYDALEPSAEENPRLL